MSRLVWFALGVVTGVAGVLVVVAWPYYGPVWIEQAPAYPAREPWGDQ